MVDKTTTNENAGAPIADADYFRGVQGGGNVKWTFTQVKAWILAFMTALFRPVLTANRTYYVRTDGSDANDGLTNTAGGAFLTIQKAIDTACSLDFRTFNVTIQVADGTYTGNMQLKTYVGVGPITILGNTGSPANVLIDVTGAFAVIGQGYLGAYTINGMKLQTNTVGFDCVLITANSQLTLSNMHYGACGSAHLHASYGASIIVATNYTIAGSGSIHWYADTGAKITAAGKTITLTGTPVFATAFAFSNNGALIVCNANTFSGAAGAVTPRFSAANNAVIATNGGGAAYLPGTAAGAGTNSGAAPYGLYV